MVRAWVFHDDATDKREPHQGPEPKFIDLEQLKNETGVLYWKLNADDYEEALGKIRSDRGYSYSDIIDCCADKLPNYEEKLENFYKEHLHADEEIRFVLEGEGYFDVRNVNDQWIRILVQKGDLLVLPSGIYHRFTLDTNNYVKVMRLFVGEPVWTAINRPADEHPARVSYLQAMA